MNQNNPFAKLGALDQKLYQETTPKPHRESVEKSIEKEQKKDSQNAVMPANQNTNKTKNQNTSKPASQKAGNPVVQQTSKTKVPEHITATERVTYRFHSEGKYAVEDMKTILARKHGIKASLEEIAEEAILIAYEELLENQNASKLANRLARSPENQNAS
jgi:hypothetical protein